MHLFHLLKYTVFSVSFTVLLARLESPRACLLDVDPLTCKNQRVLLPVEFGCILREPAVVATDPAVTLLGTTVVTAILMGKF